MKLTFFMQTADFEFAPLSNLPSRHEVMDFAYPFYSEYTGRLYKKPNTDTKVNNIYAIRIIALF